MKEEKPDIKLKVGELTNRSEVGRGIVRMDTKSMGAVSVREGDVVELEGHRKTAAIAVRSYPDDIGLNIARMDGLLRMNASVGLGETVKVSKAEAHDAKKVVIAPAQKGIILHVSPNLLKQNLMMRPMVKGDIISPSPLYKKRANGAFGDLFSMDVESLFFGTPFGFPGEVKLVVVKTAPEGVVQVVETTEVELLAEAVEIEERKIPAVTYEDIGGLGDAIRKIREMVELPLRHPEIFERLGIEPPKGVLLYGPPGTGKTLLARAVANESGANFISISGPEVMSKWYGESLPYDEKIFVMEDGIVRRKKIGEVVESGKKENLKALAFDEHGKVGFFDVTGLIKHRNSSKILEVRTKSGRRIRVTNYHSLFTLEGSRIKDVKTSELVSGESVIAVPKKIPVLGSTEEIDLLEKLREEDFGLKVRSVQRYVKEAREKLGHEKTASMLGYGKRYLYSVISGNVGIPVSKFLRLVEAAGVEYDKEKIRIFAGGKSLPAKIKLDEDFCVFLGLWIVEGSFNGNGGVRLSLNESEAAGVKDIIERLFGKCLIYRKKETKGCDIYVSSSVLAKFLKNVVGLRSGAGFKKIPEIVFNLDKNRIAAFLRGYLSGDGSVYANQHGVPTLEGSTVSGELADDLAYLLLHFGIVAKIYRTENKAGNDAYRVCFTGVDNLKKFGAIGFLEQRKNSMVNGYLENVKWSRSHQIPMTADIGSFLASTGNASQWADSASVGINKLAEFSEGSLPVEMQELVGNDIYWDKVEEIVELPKEEFVYDISVEPSQNFVAGIGGIFAHNSEQNLRRIFDDAEKNAPSIIFIDEVDAIAPKREEVTGEVERRVVAQLLALMDGMKKRGKVVVIAATNRPNSIDPALRRGGRFDREIEIGVPDRGGRLEVLQIHTRNMPLTKDVNIGSLADKTHGFVGADIEALCKEAAMSVLRRVLPDVKWKEEAELPKELLEKLIVTRDDFENALKVVEPSAMREVLVEIPNVSWDDVGGLDDVKGSLKEMIEWPLKYRDSFKRLGIKPPRGILLYGPPGCGKTLIAKAVAHEAGVNFISIKGPELMSKWVGESEKAVRDIFRRAKQVAPAIIFFDEVDAIAPRRGLEVGTHVTEQVVSQLLTEMSGLEELHDIVVIAATNRPDIIDPALLRPGRFDRQMIVPAPDDKSRLQILKVHTRSTPLAKDVSLEKLVKETDGYSGADVEALVREAAMASLREDMKSKEIRWKHFEAAMNVVKPSLTQDLMKAYELIFDKMRRTPKEKEELTELSYVG